jgi:predicted PurR-regulated permease PerM
VNSGGDPRALIRYALAGVLVTVVVAWGLFLAREALLLIYVAALFAIGLSPVVESIENRRSPSRPARVPRWVAILAIYLGVLGILIGVSILIIPALVQQARDLWTNVPMLMHNAQQWLINHGLMAREVTVQEAVQQTNRPDAVGRIIGAVWGVIGGIFGFITILILAFYILVDADNIVRTFVRLFPASERRRVEDACRRVTAKVSAWLAGQILLAAIIGGTAAVGLWLLGVPYFYVLALIAGVGEMIPIVGPVLSAIPAILVALTQSPALALAVLVFWIAQQQLENHILVPKVMSSKVGISAVIVISSLLVGGSILGIMGAILAVPTAAILQVLFEEIFPEAAAD